MLKYIIFEDATGLNSCILFDVITDHSTIKNKFSNLTVVSAGKISSGWNCRNGSVTLGIKFDLARSNEDTGIIKSLMDLN